MRSAYKILANVIAGFVAIQAAVMVFAIAGMYNWITDGNTLSESTMESEPDFTGAIGFMLHGMIGMMLIPLLALVLLIISFFAKIPGGVKWAAIVFGVVVLQYALALLTRTTGTPFLGALHGLNALILFGVAVTTAMRVRTRATRSVDATSVSAV
jgi:heme A synthase